MSVNGDTLAEGDETIILTLNGVTGSSTNAPLTLDTRVGSLTHTTTITNDDSPTVEFASRRK